LKSHKVLNFWDKNVGSKSGQNWVPNISLERFWNIHIKSDLTFSIWNYELVIIAITKVRSQICNLTPNNHYKKSQIFGLNSIFGPFCPFVEKWPKCHFGEVVLYMSILTSVLLAKGSWNILISQIDRWSIGPSLSMV